MRKSPFSTPRGNGARPSSGWSTGGSPRGGYVRSKHSEIFSPNRSSQASSRNEGESEDFISLNSCTPPSSQNRRNSGGNWQTPRGQWPSSGRGAGRHSASPGYENYREPRQTVSSQDRSGGDDFISLDSSTPPSGQDRRNFGGNRQSPRGQNQWRGNSGGRGGQSGSPGYNNYRDNRGRNHHQAAPYYVDTGKQFQGQRRNFQRGRGSQGKAHISRYVNLNSFLDDPWAELTRKLNRDAASTDSLNNTPLDSSFNNVSVDVSLDESVKSTSSLNPNRQEIFVDDSPMELENSILQTSRDLADDSECTEGSKDSKSSQDSND